MSENDKRVGVLVLTERVADLTRRVGTSEGSIESFYERFKKTDEHVVALELSVMQLLADLQPRVDRAKKWSEARHKILVHVICWGTPALLVWMLLIFAGGFRAWVKEWLLN